MPITQPKGKKIKMAQGHLKWDQNELIDEKTGCKKSRETVRINKNYRKFGTNLMFSVSYPQQDLSYDATFRPISSG